MKRKHLPDEEQTAPNAHHEVGGETYQKQAACTGIQNRCSGTPVPRWMIAKDDGGDALQIGTTTICSKSPPPKAAAKSLTILGPQF